MTRGGRDERKKLASAGILQVEGSGWGSEEITGSMSF